MNIKNWLKNQPQAITPDILLKPEYINSIFMKFIFPNKLPIFNKEEIEIMFITNYAITSFSHFAKKIGETFFPDCREYMVKFHSYELREYYIIKDSDLEDIGILQSYYEQQIVKDENYTTVKIKREGIKI